LLQDAAVVGKVMWVGTVAALEGIERWTVEERLHALERKEFVRRERRSAVDGDTQYAFSHVLVRDVAYSQIPRSDRATKHEEAARWIEALGRADEHTEMLAHHYLSALEAARAAGRETSTLIEKTRLAMREAAGRASALNAFDTALHRYDLALELSRDEDDDRIELLFETARARYDASAGSIEELVRVRDALLERGNRPAAAQAAVMAADVAWTQGLGDEVVPQLAKAYELAEPLQTSAAKAAVYARLATLHWLGSREDEARRLSSEALAMTEKLDLAPIRAQLLSMIGTMRAIEGDFAGLEELEESLSIYEELGSPDAQRPYNNLADTLYRLGRLREAADVVARMSAARTRFPNIVEWARWNRSQQLRHLYASGNWDEALELADQEIAQLEGGVRHYLEPEWRIFRARIRFARGDAAGTKVDAATAVERARESGDAQLVIPTLAVQTRLSVAENRLEAERLASELVEACRRTPLGTTSDWFPEASVAMAELGRAADVEAIAETASTPTPWLDAGRAFAAGDAAAAAQIFREMGALPWEAEARLLAARAGADAGLDEAIAFFRRVAATTFLREAEELVAPSRSA
jgi:tetratricopeptide (TPR) repeat protein